MGRHLIKGVQVVHAMPGRVRLRVSKVRDNPAFAQKAQDKLGRVPGVKRVEVKPLTGSVLIFYDAAALLAAGATAALTDGFSVLFPELGAEALTLGIESLVHILSGGEKDTSSSNFTDSMGNINAQVARITGGYDLKLLIPMTFLFFGVRSLMTSEKVAAPAWYDYLWFAFASFSMMSQWAVTQEVQAELEKRGQGGKTPEKK
jgi:hypothetical protein